MSLTVKIKALTPLWTGGLDGTMDRIHETGIIGSLRWWYEVLVRGLGGCACDPTVDGARCPDKNGNYCDACAVFGTTGLQRAFRLEGPEWWNEARGHRLTVNVKDNKGWFLGHGYLGEDEMRIIPLRLPEGWTVENLTQSLYLTMKLIECWGALGPKTQQGYGVVEFDFGKEENDKIELNIEQAITAIQNLQKSGKRRGITVNKQPALDKFFFVKVRFSTDGQNIQTWLKEWKQIVKASFESNSELDWYLNQANSNQRQSVIPLAPIVRYYLRARIRWGIQYNGHSNAPARWRLMGVLNGLWHKSDYGKIEESKSWFCPQCKQTWNYKPGKKEHSNCKGHPQRKANCLSCNKEWDSLRYAKQDTETGKVSRQSSLIHVSHAYPIAGNQWEFRIWGWIPDKLLGGVTRDTVLKRLHQWLGVSQDASQQRRWHTAQNGQLWQDINISGPKVCWFEQETNEKTVNFLRALLNACECEKEATP